MRPIYKKLGAIFAAVWLGFVPHVALAASLINPYSFVSAGPTSYVNSVQHGSITIASGQTSGTATISTVGSKAFPVWNGMVSPGNLVSSKTATRLELTNSTTVTAYRYTDDTAVITVPFTIMDPTDSLVDSVQMGTIGISSGTTGTATISSVDTSRSVVMWLGHNITIGSSATSGTRMTNAVELTDATTVTANTAYSANWTIGYAVVQFNTAAVESVQQIKDAYTDTNVTNSKTISSVNVGNSVLFFGGMLSSNNNLQYVLSTRQITSSTNVDHVRGDGNATSIAPHSTVVEFTDGVLNSKQNGVIDMTSTTSNTATVSAVDMSKSMLIFSGGYRNATANARNSQYGVSLTSPTVVTSEVGTSDAGPGASSFYLAEFN